MVQSPLMARLRKRAKKMGSKAIDDLSTSDGRGEALGSAVRKVQESRKAIDDGAGRVLGAMGLATADDLARVEKRVGRLRKRLIAVLDRL